jgi:hypothetical protein
VGWWARLLVLAALAAVAATGPADANAAAPANGWVGQVPGTQTFVGVVQRGDVLTAYACDGRRLGRWFEGRSRRGEAVLRDARGRRLVLSFRGRDVRAILDLPSRRGARFVLAPARGRAGLFRRERIVPRTGASPGELLEGWVRLNDGRVRGLGLTQQLRVRIPRPGLEVLSLPESNSTAPTPVGRAPVDARLRSAVVNPCAGRGANCALPTRGMRIGEVRRSDRVKSVDPDATLTEAALARIVAEAPRVRDREEARVIAAAGLSAFPPTLTRPANRKRFDAAARALVADKKVTDASRALRVARTVKERSAAAELLGKLGRRRLGGPIGEIERPEIAIRETGNPGTLRSFRSETLRSGAAITEEVILEGPDAEVRDFRLAEVTADLAVLSGFARAGFHSSAEFSDRAHVEITVPPGARTVEISFDTINFTSIDPGRPGCLGGFGGGMMWRSVGVWARNADGTYHIFDEESVDGTFVILEQTPVRLGPIPLAGCVLEPPIPVSGLVVSGLPGLRIANPPSGGGRFLISVEAGGQAHTIADGNASTEHRISINAITVRTEF